MTDHITRRRVLRGVGASAALPLLAGCTGGEGANGESTATPTPAGPTEPVDGTFGGWTEGVDGADTLTDLTGRSEARVRVGAEGNGGYFAFAPAVVRVSPGTTVTWTWTGSGGAHNVSAEDGSFRSSTTGSEDATFSRAFDADGVVKYACTPHEAMGMKGVVVVE